MSGRNDTGGARDPNGSDQGGVDNDRHASETPGDRAGDGEAPTDLEATIGRIFDSKMADFRKVIGDDTRGLVKRTLRAQANRGNDRDSSGEDEGSSPHERDRDPVSERRRQHDESEAQRENRELKERLRKLELRDEEAKARELQGNREKKLAKALAASGIKDVDAALALALRDPNLQIDEDRNELVFDDGENFLTGRAWAQEQLRQRPYLGDITSRGGGGGVTDPPADNSSRRQRDRLTREEYLKADTNTQLKAVLAGKVPGKSERDLG